MKMRSASGQDGYFSRVEERGWMKKLTTKMVSSASYLSEEIFVNCVSCYWMNSNLIFSQFIDEFLTI